MGIPFVFQDSRALSAFVNWSASPAQSLSTAKLMGIHELDAYVHLEIYWGIDPKFKFWLRLLREKSQKSSPNYKLTLQRLHQVKSHLLGFGWCMRHSRQQGGIDPRLQRQGHLDKVHEFTNLGEG